MAFNPKSLIYNIMKKMMQQLDNKTNLTFILILFWALFWLISSSKLYLNGAFFPWMGISADIAQLFLYLIVIGEAGLALLFISLIVWGKSPSHKPYVESGWRVLYLDRIMHRVAFKLTVLLFILFSLFDLINGDRSELFGDGVYLLLSLVSYDIWFRTDQYSMDQMQRMEMQADKAHSL